MSDQKTISQNVDEQQNAHQVSLSNLVSPQLLSFIERALKADIDQLHRLKNKYKEDFLSAKTEQDKDISFDFALRTEEHFRASCKLLTEFNKLVAG